MSVPASILSAPQLHTSPWPYFTCDHALSPAAVAHFEHLIATATDYKHHQSFYEAWLCDQSAHLDAALRDQLIVRMSKLTGLPLTARLQVSIQRMDAGHGAAPHTDRPLLGFEAARLILQFNRGWEPSHGGVFQTHSTMAGTTVTSEHPPHHNTAVGFVMTRHSFHSVTKVAAPRFTAVLYFWHIGNTAALGEAVTALTQDLDFGALPRSLHPLQDEAEQACSEEATYEASVVAVILQRWRYPDEVLHQGYADTVWPQTATTAGLWGGEVCDSSDEQGLAVTLARWVAQLSQVDFDVDQWGRLKGSLSPHDPAQYRRLASIWRLAFSQRALR